MRDPAAPAPREQWLYLGLAAFIGVLWLAMLPMRPLFNTDEGRYAEIAREMLNGGDWVIPHLNGLAYIEKPPLQYWASALSLRVFGQNEFAARLYTALCGLATVLVVGCVASRLWGPAAGWRAAAVTLGTLLFSILGQLLTLDMSLTFYMTLGLAGFLAAQPLARPARERTAMAVAWAALALGVLTKGLVAAVIPASVLVLYSLISRDFAPWRRLHPVLGLPLFLAITLPWHWLAARRLPDFLQFFFVHEHLSRYLTPSADREESWWFFGVVFLAGSLPWTLSALRVLACGWRRRAAQGEFNAPLFLWIWVVFVCVFFSLSNSKLVPYILPAMPALALLIAALPPAALRRDLALSAGLTLVAAVLLALVSLYGPEYLVPVQRRVYFAALAHPLAWIAALLGATGGCVLAQRGRDSTRAAVVLGGGWSLAGLLLMRAAAAVAPVYSGVGLAVALAAAPRAASLYSVDTYDQTLPFYLGRTVTLVAYRGELAYGLEHDPASRIESVAEFLQLWGGARQAYAVMEIGLFEELERRGVGLRELGRDAHRVAVTRP